MRKGLMLALGLAAAGPAMGQVHRCEIEGRTVYQGMPCEEVPSEEVVLRGVSGLGSGASFGGSARFEPPAEDASGQEKFRAVMSTLEVVRLKARDCDWAIKVRRDIGGCREFVATMDSQYPDALRYMSANSDSMAEVIDSVQMRRLQRITNEINDIGDFATQYIRNMR